MRGVLRREVVRRRRWKKMFKKEVLRRELAIQQCSRQGVWINLIRGREEQSAGVREGSCGKLKGN